MPVKFVFVFAWRQAWIKRKEQMPVKLVFVFCARWLKSEKSKEGNAWNWFVHGDWHCDAWRGFWLREEVRYYLDKLVHWKLWKSLGDTWTVLRSFRITWVTLYDCIGGDVHGDWHWWHRIKLLNCFGLGKKSDTTWTLSSLKIVEIIVG